MTHDLLKNAIELFGAHIDEVVINDLSEGTFYARISYHRNGEQMEQDARPSDAIALAARFNAPIFVGQEILDEAGIISEDKTETAGSRVQSSRSSENLTKMEMLENELQTAVDTENYEKAARIRDQINKLKG